MSILTSIYQTLNGYDESYRKLPSLDLKGNFAPWNSPLPQIPIKGRSKIITPRKDSFLKTARAKDKLNNSNTSPFKQSIKRTSYCFQTQIQNKQKEFLESRRYSSDQTRQYQSPRRSFSNQKKTKIKSFNDREQIRKYSTITKMSSLSKQESTPSSFKTMLLFQSYGKGVQIRSRNIQMIRHISQKKVTPL